MALFLARHAIFHEKECHVNAAVTKLMDEPPLFVGPLMKLDSCVDGVWKGDILFIHTYSIHPILYLTDDKDDGHTTIVNREIIATEFNFHFTKWTITVKQDVHSKRQNYSICYTVDGISTDPERCDSTQQFCFFVPGLDVPWKWAFFSCNDLSHTSGYKGYSEKYGGIVPLWADLVHKHHRYNYNLLIGLGDQVYMDEVFEHVKELDRWTRIANHITRESMPCSTELKDNVARWSFFYYMHHFSQPYFDQAMATIPSLFVMSDHDTYDGQGSYPPELENSPVLKNTREILQKWYLLFQQHQNPSAYFDKVRGNDGAPLYGDTVTPCVKQMGDDLAILALDTRFERTRERIIKDATYEYIFSCLERLPPTTLHLVIATEIPLIFPDIRFAEKWLRKISDTKRNKVFQKIFKWSKFSKRIGFPFGEPILLTDMIDHWNSKAHMEERNRFIFRLQEFSQRRTIRVTFIGGDVHCCGIGRFSTPSSSHDRIRARYENEMTIPTKFATDHRLMYQIISSAIANVPPPWYILKAYHVVDKPEKIRDGDGMTDARMLRFFLRDTKGKVLVGKLLGGNKGKKLMGRRNWCSVEMSSVDDSLFFELHVEMFLGAGKTVPYNVIVPKLE